MGPCNNGTRKSFTLLSFSKSLSHQFILVSSCLQSTLLPSYPSSLAPGFLEAENQTAPQGPGERTPSNTTLVGDNGTQSFVSRSDRCHWCFTLSSRCTGVPQNNGERCNVCKKYKHACYPKDADEDEKTLRRQAQDQTRRDLRHMIESGVPSQKRGPASGQAPPAKNRDPLPHRSTDVTNSPLQFQSLQRTDVTGGPNNGIEAIGVVSPSKRRRSPRKDSKNPTADPSKKTHANFAHKKLDTVAVFQLTSTN